jgi:hypothetical protein
VAITLKRSGTQFTCFTSTKVQILTQKWRSASDIVMIPEGMLQVSERLRC